jgi:tellurite resistance-related uncharacterized protein
MGAPLTIGTIVVFQKFGVDIHEVDMFESLTVLKKSVDFVGYDVDGEYSGANYNATTYKDMQDDYVFKGKESFEIEFEDTDDVFYNRMIKLKVV